MRLWVGISLSTTFIMVVVFGFTMGILVTSWRDNVQQQWQETSLETLRYVQDNIEDHLRAVQFAGRNVPVPVSDSISSQAPTPDTLLEYFVRHRPALYGYNISSLGYLTRANNTVNGKVSWQIAEYQESCPVWGYFFSDNAIHPDFQGYCADDDTINFGIQAYDGQDWGLKTEESRMVDGTLQETFLPVFTLLGQRTLTYETRRTDDGYVSFADVNIETLSVFLQQNITLFNGRGVAYIMDDATDTVIASTVPRPIETTSQWQYVRASTITRTGLSWTTYVTVESLYTDMYYRIAVACGVCGAIALILSNIGVYFWITKPLHSTEIEEKVYTPFSDFH